MPTLTIDNFGGRLTRFDNGDINSGFAKFDTTYSNDPFRLPGKLTWNETATRIDSAGSVITGAVVAGKVRVESGLSYLYCVDHLARVYKIQVNNSTNPSLDDPVLLATLSSNSPAFTRGGFIDFFGTTERIYIGHDIGVTRLDFDGTNETFIGVAGSYTATVPRPLKQFLGNLYFGNGNNIGEILPGATISTYGKLSPTFPTNTQVRDLDIAPDGSYLEAVVSRLALPSILTNTQDTTLIANTESYIFKWNGTDIGYTSFTSYPSFSLNSNISFGSNQYIFGYDLTGSSVFTPTQKILSPIFTEAPLPTSVNSNGNFVAWVVPEFYNGFTRTALYLYGSLDTEVTNGWWRQFAQGAQGSQTDVLKVPFSMAVSNFGIGASTNGYTGGVFGRGKVYFSTIEIAGTTLAYKFYKWNAVSATAGTYGTSVYETQTQLFSKKIKPSEVRVYTEPLVASNVFTIDLIGSDGTVITSSSKTFTVGTSPVAVGDELVRYTLAIEPTYAIGVRVTNTGTTNWVCNKIEIDYEPSGK